MHAQLLAVHFPGLLGHSGAADSILAASGRTGAIQGGNSRISIFCGGQVHKAVMVRSGGLARRSGRAENLAHSLHIPVPKELARLDIERVLVSNLGQAADINTSTFVRGGGPPRGCVVPRPAVVGVCVRADAAGGYFLCFPPLVVGLGRQPVSGRIAPIGLVVNLDRPMPNQLAG